MMVAPSLDNAMSPKRQALIIKQYIADGYTPLAYNTYSGIFTYYAGRNLNQTDELNDVARMVEDDDKVVLVIREKHWKTWPDRPTSLKIVDRQDIAGTMYLLLTKD